MEIRSLDDNDTRVAHELFHIYKDLKDNENILDLRNVDKENHYDLYLDEFVDYEVVFNDEKDLYFFSYPLDWYSDDNYEIIDCYLNKKKYKSIDTSIIDDHYETKARFVLDTINEVFGYPKAIKYKTCGFDYMCECE